MLRPILKLYCTFFFLNMLFWWDWCETCVIEPLSHIPQATPQCKNACVVQTSYYRSTHVVRQLKMKEAWQWTRIQLGYQTDIISQWVIYCTFTEALAQGLYSDFSTTVVHQRAAEFLCDHNSDKKTRSLQQWLTWLPRPNRLSIKVETNFLFIWSVIWQHRSEKSRWSCVVFSRSHRPIALLLINYT